MKPFFLLSRKRCLSLLGAFCALAFLLALLVRAIPTQLAAAQGPAERKIPIYCTDRPEKVVSLTFDAAWGDEDTAKLIEIFQTYGVHVTFFVVGEWADRCSESVRALQAAGHEVMNHSDTHPHMPQLSSDGMVTEIRACNDKIEALTGNRPLLFRAPYGDYNNTLIETLDHEGMYCIQWDVDSLDWKDPPVEAIVSRVTSRVQPGSIVLFHNAAKNTPAALPAIIESLQAQGYSFLKASEMIYRENYRINHEGRQCRQDDAPAG